MDAREDNRVSMRSKVSRLCGIRKAAIASCKECAEMIGLVDQKSMASITYSAHTSLRWTLGDVFDTFDSLCLRICLEMFLVPYSDVYQ